MALDISNLANEIDDAFTNRRVITQPTARGIGFDLAAAYAVETELVRRNRAEGRQTVGIKVGFANKAMWRVLKLSTLVWAHMYDDTIRRASTNTATLALASLMAPKIEPEIVFTMKHPLAPGTTEPAAVLDAVESIALGFEIIDCPYADWKFQPADFVAAYGLHAALIVGEPQAVTAARIPALAEALPQFTVTLSKDGAHVEEGAGKNSLRSPALCLAELVSAMAAQGSAPLEAGDLVSSGTLTAPKPIGAGETWTAEVHGLNLPALSLHTE
jgi:2-keto-4-pentenoate hydratase